VAAERSSQERNSTTWRNVFYIIAIAVIVFFTVLRFLHIEADFPGGVTKSGMLYTDEGANSNAGMACVLSGHWYVEGDFNQAINLPVFQFIQLLSFKTFGLSLQSARLTGLIFFLGLLLILFFLIKTHTNVRTALISLLLLSANYHVFVYSRLALLEIPMTFFLMLSIFLAANQSQGKQSVFIFFSALIFFLAILTKTIALFALPMLLYILFIKNQPTKSKIFHGALLCSLIGVFLTVYYFVLVKTHLQDYQFYYSTNLYTRTQMAPMQLVRNIAKTVFYGQQIDLILFPVASIYAIIFMITIKQLRRNSLFWISIIWMSVYIVMISTQNYAPPRYYTPLVFPLVMIVAIIIDYFLRTGFKSVKAAVFTTAVLISLTINSSGIVRYIASPNYSWITMAEDVKSQIENDGLMNSVLLGHFSNSISLVTGIFSINDHWGSRDLEFKIKEYDPNYYVCLGSIDEDIGTVMERYYYIEKIKEYDVFDNYYTGEPVVLYKLSKK